jgi:hypothetical protein
VGVVEVVIVCEPSVVAAYAVLTKKRETRHESALLRTFFKCTELSFGWFG